LSSVLGGYTVMQKADWSGRTFYAAQDRRSGQVVHLVATRATDSLEPYQHASLPHLQPLVAEGDMLWLSGAVSEGDTLEDLRNGAHLSESDMVSALLTVLDGLASLARLPGTPVPSYVDPACVRRDSLGRWKLDYLALAHAPEARMPATEPYGVHPFGILLYWLITGQTVRRSRVPLSRVEHGISAALQFVLIRALGRIYPSLAELRADIERAGQEHEFRPILHKPLPRPAGGQPVPHPVRLPVAQSTTPGSVVPLQPKSVRQTEELLTHIPVIPMNHPQVNRPPATPPQSTPVQLTQTHSAPPKRLPELEHHRVTLGGGPQIPMDDRPWALPPRPAGGYRKYVVPPPPNPKVVKAIRVGSLSLVSLATVFLTGAVMLKAGILPPDLLPSLWRSPAPVAGRPEPGGPGGLLPPEPAGPVYGPTLPGPGPGQPEPEQPGPTEPREPIDEPVEEPIEEPPPVGGINPPPPPVVTPPPVKNPPAPPKTTPIPPVEPPKTPVPTPPANPPTEPPNTKRPEPEPGSGDFADASQGGLATRIHFNGNDLGWAYIIPHPTSPYITINTFNRLFGQNVYWIPMEGSSIRLVNGAHNVITTDYTLVRDRLWLKLTPFLQEALGIHVTAYNEKGIFFTQ
jgi:hypothetical protein